MMLMSPGSWGGGKQVTQAGGGELMNSIGNCDMHKYISTSYTWRQICWGEQKKPAHPSYCYLFVLNVLWILQQAWCEKLRVKFWSKILPLESAFCKSGSFMHVWKKLQTQGKFCLNAIIKGLQFWQFMWMQTTLWPQGRIFGFRFMCKWICVQTAF